MSGARILVAGDQRKARWSFERILAPLGCEVLSARNGEEALRLCAEAGPDLAFVDLHLPDVGGLEVLKRLRGICPDTAVVMVTTLEEAGAAAQAVRQGARDYLSSPLDLGRVPLLVEQCLENARLRHEVLRLRQRAAARDALVGESERMRQVRELVGKLAASAAATVLIFGESGTGKHLVAREIHARSARGEGPFIDVTCTAVPGPTFASELFGCEKGPLASAESVRKGLLELADGGTLFLDEVADIPLAAQGQLVRVIEHRSFRRVGGGRDRAVNFRLIAASRKDLREEVRAGRFREDLYYRLQVVPVFLPPLRERAGDIPVLLSHFIGLFNQQLGKRFRGASAEALARLAAYPWPGNVREMRNVVERIMLLEDDTLIHAAHLPPEVREWGGRRGTGGAPRLELPPTGIRLEEVERDLLRQALRLAGGNRSRAARLLGISRDTLRYRIGKHGLVGTRAPRRRAATSPGLQHNSAFPPEGQAQLPAAG